MSEGKEITILGLIDHWKAAYHIFLQKAGLEDTPLTDILFFNAAKQEIAEAPMPNERHQTILLKFCEARIKDATGRMYAAMEQAGLAPVR